MNLEEIKLPGLNCGLCGFRTCEEFAARLKGKPELIERCVALSPEQMAAATEPLTSPCVVCPVEKREACATGSESTWRDHLGREFDFYLERFPEDPGPREIILPHNPMLTREMEIHPEEILIGRPLGMSCGCPVTHCGVVQEVDMRTGVIVWCVVGPLNPRLKGYKDLGYYIAEGYEGLIRETRAEIKIGLRYFFLPRMCMLQWRHSGLVNYSNRTPDGLQVRLEGLWIG
jgi:uncharacterized Fe-S cluster-containing protein